MSVGHCVMAGRQHKVVRIAALWICNFSDDFQFEHNSDNSKASSQQLSFSLRTADCIIQMHDVIWMLQCRFICLTFLLQGHGLYCVLAAIWMSSIPGTSLYLPAHESLLVHIFKRNKAFQVKMGSTMHENSSLNVFAKLSGSLSSRLTFSSRNYLTALITV